MSVRASRVISGSLFLFYVSCRTYFIVRSGGDIYMKRKVMFVVIIGCITFASTPNIIFANEHITEKSDGYEIIENNNTKRTETTNCQLFSQVSVPDGFQLNTYALLQDDLGITYRIVMSGEETYEDYIFLAPGHYRVVEVGVVNDYKSEYPFTMEQNEIVLEENSIQTIAFRLKDYEKIEEETNKKRGILKNTRNQRYPTGIKQIHITESGEIHYDVTHNGTGKGNLDLSGFGKADCNLVIKIVKSGVIGEARFAVSIDGGETYFAEDIVADTCKIGNLGIELSFTSEEDTAQFVMGDTFSASIHECYQVITSGSMSKVNLMVTGHPMENHDLIVTILSSGGCGKSTFTVSMDNGKTVSYTDQIPKNGIYQLEDDLTLIFSDTDGYQKDLNFISRIKSNDETINYKPFIVLIIICITVVLALFVLLLRKMEKKSTYHINKWNTKGERKYD